MTTEAPEREAEAQDTPAEEPSEPQPAPLPFIKFTFNAPGSADAQIEMSDGLGALQLLGLAAWLDFRGRSMLTMELNARMQRAAMEQQARAQVMSQLDPHKLHRVD